MNLHLLHNGQMYDVELDFELTERALDSLGNRESLARAVQQMVFVATHQHEPWDEPDYEGSKAEQDREEATLEAAEREAELLEPYDFDT